MLLLLSHATTILCIAKLSYNMESAKLCFFFAMLEENHRCDLLTEKCFFFGSVNCGRIAIFRDFLIQ